MLRQEKWYLRSMTDQAIPHRNSWPCSVHCTFLPCSSISALTRRTIVDSNDWQGLTASQIVTDVTQGYTSNWYTGTAFFHAIQADFIIALHDDGNQNTIASLQGIVDYMNAHHLGATATVRPDATGEVLAFTNGVSNNATSVNGQALRVKKLGRQE